jgi:hypothetical protein
MDNGTYGPPIGSPASGNDRFGYFGGTPTPGTPDQPNAIGAPPGPTADQLAGPPVSQFGGPTSPFGGPAGPTDVMARPYAAQPEPGRTGRSSTSRWIGAVLAGLVVIGGGYFVWNAIQRNRAVTLPTSFGGLPVDTEPSAQTTDQSMLASMRAGNPGIKMDAKIYGTSKDAIILGVARGHDDLSKDLQGQGLGTPFTLGNNLCAQTTTGVAYTLCVRTSTNLTVVVATLSGAPAQTSALVDQAWSQF